MLLNGESSMLKSINIEQSLQQEKSKNSTEDMLLEEANRILLKNRLNEKNILDNLKFYNSSFEFLDDDEVDARNLFTPQQIKKICIKYRLRFLPSQHYSGDIPYEALLKIKNLNKEFRKEIKHFKILSADSFFTDSNSNQQSLLFAQTLQGNYYLLHTWGLSYNRSRLIKYFPARSFETLLSIFLFLSVVETALLPNSLLSTDIHAGYFSMYRVAALFHLLILQCGLGVLYLMAAHFTFSANNWDSVPRKN
jgi:hypothetical protein